MKKEIKKNIIVSFKNATLNLDDERIIVVEYDKDGCVVNEIALLDAIGFLVGKEGLDIAFKKSNTIDE